MYDVLVAGAGPAGSTAARLLAKAGWSVALVEKTTFPRRKVCGEFISATTLPLLGDPPTRASWPSNSGPEIRRVGLFAGETMICSKMPAASYSADMWGRAIAREHLDLMLARAAAEAGADMWQPWKLTALHYGSGFAALLSNGRETREIEARVVIAATGSWERNPFSAGCDIPHRPWDLLAFKTHFRNSKLAGDLMPLLVFPGGYGGMVHAGGGHLSLSFCINRDTLQLCRDMQPGCPAAEAALQHIMQSCKGVREVLSGAEREESWLAAGPIRPGLRPCHANGIFFTGNLAGEAHPIVAEGISMAMQSAWLLCRLLLQNRREVLGSGPAEMIGRLYTRQWRRAFAGRIRAAALFANLAMQEKAALAARVLARFPEVLTFGARMSGKAVQIVR